MVLFPNWMFTSRSHRFHIAKACLADTSLDLSRPTDWNNCARTCPITREPCTSAILQHPAFGTFALTVPVTGGHFTAAPTRDLPPMIVNIRQQGRVLLATNLCIQSLKPAINVHTGIRWMESFRLFPQRTRRLCTLTVHRHRTTKLK